MLHFRHSITVVILGGLVLLLTRPAEAQVQCAEHAALTKHLHERFAETVAATGVDGRGRRTELYRSETGSWTFVVIPTEGQACILSAGRNWVIQDSSRSAKKGRKI